MRDKRCEDTLCSGSRRCATCRYGWTGAVTLVSSDDCWHNYTHVPDDIVAILSKKTTVVTIGYIAATSPVIARPGMEARQE